MLVILSLLFGVYGLFALSPMNETDNDLFTVSSLISQLRKDFLLLSADSKLLNFYSDEEYLDLNDFLYASEIEKRTVLYLTSFAWFFKDLNNLVWKYPENEAKYDELKKLINYHCREDGSHFLFHIYDFNKLGLNDINIKPTDFLLYLFGDLTEGGRYTIYEYIYYDGLIDGKNNPVARYIIMQSLEIAGYHFFKAIDKNYQRYLKEMRGKYNLRYLGNIHNNLESGSIHSTKDENGYNNADKIFGDIILSKNKYNKYLKIAKLTTDRMIHDLWQNEYQFITKKFNQQSYFNNLIKF